MSKFCGVISSCGQRLKQSPLQFIHLDIIAKCLIHETEEMGTDFENKAMFINELQQQTAENGKDLIAINDNVRELFDAMETLENEMHENDQRIEQLEKSVQNLECVAELFTTTQKYASNQGPGSEKETMLQMLERTHRVMLYLNGLMDNIHECEQFVQQEAESNPYNIICAILEMHVRTLQQTDAKLDTLLNKTLTVDKAFEQVMNKIGTMKPSPYTRLDSNLKCAEKNLQNLHY